MPVGKVGTIVVWRLDRLGRTVIELLTWLQALDVAGVGPNRISGRWRKSAYSTWRENSS